MKLRANVAALAAAALAIPPLGGAPSTPDAPTLEQRLADLEAFMEFSEGGKPSPDKIAAEIRKLGDESYKVREAATSNLWTAGALAEDQLRAALSDPDPEIVKRANFVLKRLDFGILPGTAAAVVDLVNRYHHAPRDQKGRLIYQLREQRAWRQILKLYSTENDPDVRTQIRGAVDGVATLAAREALAEGKTAEARSYLELNPGDAPGLLALADFHRSQGTLKDELARRDKFPGGAGKLSWELALRRVSGEFALARAAAGAAGEGKIEAAMAILEGDPLPWLKIAAPDDGPANLHELYRNAAVKHWRGQPLDNRDLEAFEPLLEGGDTANRLLAAGDYFLLGQTERGEASLLQLQPVEAFKHLDALERIPEALAALKLDPEKPDFKPWLEKHFKALTAEEDENAEDESGDHAEDLAAVAIFMERRGLEKDIAAFVPLMTKLAGENSETFLQLLGRFFGTGDTPGAVKLARRIAAEWAGEDEIRWQQVSSQAFGETPQVSQWWDWVGQLDPDATRPARFDAMLALFRYGSPSPELRKKFLDRAWAAVAKEPEKVKLLVYLASSARDLETGLKAWERIPENQRAEDANASFRIFLSAAGRWDEAAALWMKAVETYPAMAEFHAYAAACLRRAGNEAEALVQDRWADKLVLGDTSTCFRVAQAYLHGGDLARAARWWLHGLALAPPGTELWAHALQVNAVSALSQDQWSRAAALHEIVALVLTDYNGLSVASGTKLRVRMNADFCRALAGLSGNREKSIALLRRCHSALAADGSLADYFFPSLRKAGLQAEHDEWFEQSWKLLQPVIAKYPACENTRNTAAWLASRSLRRLDEAEEHVARALETSPDQAAYLDTRAEIHFARKDRKTALEWSARAVASEPIDNDLRKQYFRFKFDPFP